MSSTRECPESRSRQCVGVVSQGAWYALSSRFWPRDSFAFSEAARERASSSVDMTAITQKTPKKPKGLNTATANQQTVARNTTVSQSSKSSQARKTPHSAHKPALSANPEGPQQTSIDRLTTSPSHAHARTHGHARTHARTHARAHARTHPPIHPRARTHARTHDREPARTAEYQRRPEYNSPIPCHCRGIRRAPSNLGTPKAETRRRPQ